MHNQNNTTFALPPTDAARETCRTSHMRIQCLGCESPTAHCDSHEFWPTEGVVPCENLPTSETSALLEMCRMIKLSLGDFQWAWDAEKGRRERNEQDCVDKTGDAQQPMGTGAWEIRPWVQRCISVSGFHRVESR